MDNLPVTIPIRIGSQSRVFERSGFGKKRVLNYRPGECGSPPRKELLSVLYMPSGVLAYHRHEIGRSWVPTAPRGVLGTGSIRVQSLSPREFLSNVPCFALLNRSKQPWFPIQTIVLGCEVDGDVMRARVSQNPRMEGIGVFEIIGRLARPLTFLDGRAVLEVSLTDIFKAERELRIYHDGHSNPALGIQHSTRFDLVTSIGFDGVRLRLLYGTRRSGPQVATLYRSRPDGLYHFVRADHNCQVNSLVRELRPNFVLGVTLARRLEQSMLKHGRTYDHGILGAEIACSIASKTLMDDALRMSEPAVGGPDLLSGDRRTAIEARLLTRTRSMSLTASVREAARHFKQMKERLHWEMSAQGYKRGLAILSLQLSSQVVTLVRDI